MVSATEDKLLTSEEVADILRVKRRAIYTLAAAGKIPKPIKFERAYRWRLSTLNAWLSQLEESKTGTEN